MRFLSLSLLLFTVLFSISTFVFSSPLSSSHPLYALFDQFANDLRTAGSQLRNRLPSIISQTEQKLGEITTCLSSPSSVVCSLLGPSADWPTLKEFIEPTLNQAKLCLNQPPQEVQPSNAKCQDLLSLLPQRPIATELQAPTNEAEIASAADADQVAEQAETSEETQDSTGEVNEAVNYFLFPTEREKLVRLLERRKSEIESCLALADPVGSIRCRRLAQNTNWPINVATGTVRGVKNTYNDVVKYVNQKTPDHVVEAGFENEAELNQAEQGTEEPAEPAAPPTPSNADPAAPSSSPPEPAKPKSRPCRVLCRLGRTFARAKSKFARIQAAYHQMRAAFANQQQPNQYQNQQEQ
jgi:hypothetical protein